MCAFNSARLLWKYLLVWTDSCSFADEEEEKSKEQKGMWIVGMCFPRSACEVLSCLGESEAGVHLSIMDDQYKYWWVVVVGEFQSCCLSVDVWQILVAPTEVAASVEPVLGAGVWVGAQFEPPG